MRNEQSKPWADDRPRRDALVLGLIDQATTEAPSDVDAASALMRSAATVLTRRMSEMEACDLLVVALLETKASLLVRRHAH